MRNVQWWGRNSILYPPLISLAPLKVKKIKLVYKQRFLISEKMVHIPPFWNRFRTLFNIQATIHAMNRHTSFYPIQPVFMDKPDEFMREKLRVLVVCASLTKEDTVEESANIILLRVHK